jgi:hypothetical protein
MIFITRNAPIQQPGLRFGEAQDESIQAENAIERAKKYGGELEALNRVAFHPSGCSCNEAALPLHTKLVSSLPNLLGW